MKTFFVLIRYGVGRLPPVFCFCFGVGASFVPVFFVDDPGSKQTQHDLVRSLVFKPTVLDVEWRRGGIIHESSEHLIF